MKIDTATVRIDGREFGPYVENTVGYTLVMEIMRLNAALSRAAAPEPEWEYGRAHPGVWKRAPGVGVVVLADTPGNREPQEAEGYLIVRRRKAGPWEPLPAGGDDE